MKENGRSWSILIYSVALISKYSPDWLNDKIAEVDKADKLIFNQNHLTVYSNFWLSATYVLACIQFTSEKWNCTFS